MEEKRVDIFAVLFDLDGTLIDTLSLILESFRVSLGELGLSASENEILETIGLPLREVCFHFAGDRGEELFRCYVEYQDAIHDAYIKEYPGTTSMLEYLKSQGLLIGIVTSKRRVMAERGLKVAGLDRFVDTMVTFDDTTAHKPDPEPVLTALSLLRVPAQKALFVGDSPYDIRCGKKAGTATAGVTWGVSSREDLEKENPDLILQDWSQFQRFLERKPAE